MITKSLQVQSVMKTHLMSCFFVHIKLTDEKVAKAHDDEPLINAEFKEIEIKTKFNEKIWTTLFGNLFVFHSSLFLLTSTLK